MIIYIDNDNKCHAAPAEGLTAVEVPFFDGKCKKFVEGYRYVPPGKIWVRADGRTFHGEMVAPFVDYAILAAYQAQYEADRVDINAMAADLKDADDALAEMGVEFNG